MRANFKYKKYYCVDCGIQVCHKTITRCRKCYGKLQAKRQLGYNNHNIKHGRSINHTCTDCGIKISYKSTRCVKCAGIYRSKVYRGLMSKQPLIRSQYKIKYSNCIDCGQKIDITNQRCRTCHTLWCIGEHSPTWLGGVSKYPYGAKWNNRVREQVRKRDNYKCQECGVHQSECLSKLDVHHIDYDKTNNDINNLISLCHSCHASLCMRPDGAVEKYRGLICDMAK